MTTTIITIITTILISTTTMIIITVNDNNNSKKRFPAHDELGTCRRRLVFPRACIQNMTMKKPVRSGSASTASAC